MTQFRIQDVSRETILEMVKQEQTVRYSKGIQDIYYQQYILKSTNPDYVDVNIEKEIQKYILRKFGFNDDLPSLKEYWKIPSTYWNDDEIKNSIFYMKLNIFQYPKLKVEDDLTDVALIDYTTGQEHWIRSLQTPDRPLILLAGSMT